MGKTNISQDRHEELPQTTIYVIEIPSCWSHHNVYDLFSPYGAINSINIHTKPNSNSKYCYIKYCSFISVQHAVNSLNNKILQVDNTPFKLELVNKHQGSTIVVEDIDESITDDQFHKAFMPYGTIIEWHLNRDDDGPIRGLVTFNSYEEAACAISNMHGRMLLQKQLQVFFPLQNDGSRGSYNAQTQKNIIGERLYRFIMIHQPALAGKITGMLLELDNGELFYYLQSPEAFLRKIDEALAVLEAHGLRTVGMN
jgi:RNA recognition motif-containing protein